MDSCANMTFSVAALNHTAFHFKNMSNKLVGINGRDFKILQVLSLKMQFKYALVTPDDNKYGECNDQPPPNAASHCNGMIGMVERHEADMAISEISPTASRSKYVNLSLSYFQDEVTFATKRIDTQQVVDNFFFLKPLDKRAWMLLLSFLVVIIFLIKVSERLNKTKTKIKILQTMMEIILRQNINLKRNVDKLSIVATLLVFVVTAGCTCKLYECVLTSKASLTPVSPPIDTISDMVDAIKNRDYVISATEGTSFHQEIMTSKVEYLKIFAESITNRSFVVPKTPKDGLALVLVEKFAAIAGRDSLKRTVMELNFPQEAYHYAKDYIYVDQNVVALRNQFPCHSDVNKWLNLLTDSGLINKWQREDLTVFNQSRTSIATNSFNTSYIGLNDLIFIFLILSYGFLAGFVIVLKEVITFNYQSRLRGKCGN